MLEEIKRNEWEVFFRAFNGRNETRPTRLEVLGGVGPERTDSRIPVETDYWLEDGLPLTGVSLEPEGKGAPRVEIMLGGEAAGHAEHLTRTVTGAQRVKRTIGEDGRESALEIEDGEGAVTILHF